MVLCLEWEPHGPIDSLKPTADGEIPAGELRDLLRKFRRQGPANTFYPPGFPETLPEMACCRHDFPICYKMEMVEHVGNKSLPSASSLPSAPFDLQQLSHRCQLLTGNSMIGWISRRLHISPHHVSGASGHGVACQYLAVRYEKGILICHTMDLKNPAVKLVPSHPWLHAMDTQTYPHQEAKQFRPLCTDASCANYYQRAKHQYACSLLA